MPWKPVQRKQNQFSTTTKLNGEVVLGLTVRREYLCEVDDVTILAAGPRLNAETSFTGEICWSRYLHQQNTDL